LVLAIGVVKFGVPAREVFLYLIDLIAKFLTGN